MASGAAPDLLLAPALLAAVAPPQLRAKPATNKLAHSAAAKSHLEAHRFVETIAFALSEAQQNT